MKWSETQRITGNRRLHTNTYISYLWNILHISNFLLHLYFCNHGDIIRHNMLYRIHKYPAAIHVNIVFLNDNHGPVDEGSSCVSSRRSSMSLLKRLGMIRVGYLRTGFPSLLIKNFSKFHRTSLLWYGV